MQFDLPSAEPVRAEPALRVLVLGAVYAVAVFFAVAFSPNMGFVTPHNAPTAVAAAGPSAIVNR